MYVRCPYPQFCLNCVLAPEEIQLDTPLMETGMDSLSSVAFRNALNQTFTGINLPASLMFDYPNAPSLATALVQVKLSMPVTCFMSSRRVLIVMLAAIMQHMGIVRFQQCQYRHLRHTHSHRHYCYHEYRIPDQGQLCWYFQCHHLPLSRSCYGRDTYQLHHE